MEHRQAPGDPEESSVTANGTYDTPEMGTNGLIGDGRYRLTRRLGRGGMAEVFAAEDVRLGRTVAVKLLRADLAEDSIAKARFTREAQSVAGLNHHAVVAVYDSGEDRMGNNVVPYIVMELVEGHTIRDLLINEEAPPVDPEGVTIERVIDPVRFGAIDDLMAAVYGADEDWRSEVLGAELAAAPDRLSVYLAMADGHCVSAGWIRFNPGTVFADLWGGATRPHWRGRGIYRALVAKRAAEAKQRGFRILTVDASPESRPILERLGFRALTTTTPYVREA